MKWGFEHAKMSGRFSPEYTNLAATHFVSQRFLLGVPHNTSHRLKVEGRAVVLVIDVIRGQANQDII